MAGNRTASYAGEVFGIGASALPVFGVVLHERDAAPDRALQMVGFVINLTLWPRNSRNLLLVEQKAAAHAGLITMTALPAS